MTVPKKLKGIGLHEFGGANGGVASQVGVAARAPRRPGHPPMFATPLFNLRNIQNGRGVKGPRSYAAWQDALD